MILDAERFYRNNRSLSLQEWLVFKNRGDIYNQEEVVGEITGLSGPVLAYQEPVLLQ